MAVDLRAAARGPQPAARSAAAGHYLVTARAVPLVTA
jgi:hypothetical protein